MITDTSLPTTEDFVPPSGLLATEFTIVKRLLESEKSEDTGEMSIIPITHNPKLLILLVDGWAIHLTDDGRWTFEDTTGG